VGVGEDLISCAAVSSDSARRSTRDARSNSVPRAGALQSGRSIICGVHDLHAATAAAVGRLDATGQPTSLPNLTTSLAFFSASLRPGTPSTPIWPARRLRSCHHDLDGFGGGPMKVTPREVIARANSVFSEKNP